MYTLNKKMESILMRIARGVRPAMCEDIKTMIKRGYISVDENDLTASGYVLSDDSVRYLQENYGEKFDHLISEAKLKVKKAVACMKMGEDTIMAKALQILEDIRD